MNEVSQKESEIILEFLEESKSMLLDYLIANDRNASGRTAAAIKTADLSDFGGKLLGPEHVFYTFKGRGPGSMPPLSKIVEWCNAKGIPRSRAWIIADRIKREGTKLYRSGGSTALEEATAKERIDTLIDNLKKTIISQLRSDLNEVINK